jgi:secernin
MCDTIIAMPEATMDGSIIFGKNSDREPNEAQNITFSPAKKHPKGSTVTCTYLAIPQVEKTHASLLSRPFWMFGAEMGVNEHGVVIGNEAVFTREKYRKENALTGMDLLRLALERSQTATEAMETIIDLIDRYNQGGNCAMEGSLYYHNSFIIADTNGALILETADRHWVAKSISKFGAISNCLTIGEDYDNSSSGIEDYALRKGYINKGENHNFTNAFSDTLFTHFARGRARVSCSIDRLSRHHGSISLTTMMEHLRDHNTDSEFTVGQKPMRSICLHAGGLVSSQSTGSMVVKLKKGAAPLVFVTGTSAPCLGLFKPLLIKNTDKNDYLNGYSSDPGNGMIDVYGPAENVYNPATLWWRGEEIHRRVLINYSRYSTPWINSMKGPESKAVDSINSVWKTNNRLSLHKAVIKTNKNLLLLYNDSIENFKASYKKGPARMSLLARIQWGKTNKKAKFQL